MKVVVVGAGIMGSSIAQLAAMHSHDVINVDVSSTALERACASVSKSLERFSRAGRVKPEEIIPIIDRISYSEALGQAVSDADVADAERVVGMHFFNPPVMMRLLELIPGQLTSAATLARAQEFGSSVDREVVVLKKDIPGFITTRVSAAVRLECLRILEEGVASASDIDKACKLGLNFPMGPLELGDFNGLDTFLDATESLSTVHGDRYRPPAVLRNMVMAGLTGRKSGEGFYRYDDAGKRLTDET